MVQKYSCDRPLPLFAFEVLLNDETTTMNFSFLLLAAMYVQYRDTILKEPAAYSFALPPT